MLAYSSSDNDNDRIHKYMLHNEYIHAMHNLKK